jgi:hypothetical protein
MPGEWAGLRDKGLALLALAAYRRKSVEAQVRESIADEGVE